MKVLNHIRRISSVPIWVISTCFAILLLVSCEPVGPSPDIADCQATPATTYNDYSFTSKQGGFHNIFVLLEKPSNSSELVKLVDLVDKNIIANLSTGDRLIVAWLDNNPTTQSIMLDEIVRSVTLPELPLKPEPPMVKPMPTPEGLSSTQINRQHIESTRVFRENELEKVLYHCKIGEWNLTSNRIYEQWQDDQQNAIKDLSFNLHDEIESVVQSDENLSNDLLDTLKMVSQIMRPSIDEGSYDKHSLFIFSDLSTVDYESENLLDNSIDLSGINLHVVTEQCKYELDCVVRDTWEYRFNLLGVGFPIFSDKVDISIFDISTPCTNSEQSYIYPNFIRNNTHYVFILVDKSFRHSEYFDESQNLIESQIVRILSSGDRLTVGWIDLQAKPTDSIFFDGEVPTIPLPQLPPTITQRIPRNPRTVNELKENENCKIAEWNAIGAALFLKWQEDQQIAVMTIIADYENVAEHSGFEDGKLVYEALEMATLFIRPKIEQGLYDHYSLLIFSDMFEWRDIAPNDVEIDMQGMDVLMIAQQCQYHQGGCIDLQTKWERLTTQYGADSIKFIVQEDNLEQSLSNYFATDTP